MAVHFEATSDVSKVAADYDKLVRENVRLREKMLAVTKESSSQGSIISSTIGNGVSQLRNMAAGYFSVHGMISLVNAGLEEQKRISQEINRVQMTAADAQAEVVKNLGNVSTEQASRFLKEVEGIAAKTGAPSVAPVYEAAAQTLSAVGDEQLTKSILSETIPLFKGKMAELPTFAGAVGDLANISGAKSESEIRRIVSLIMSSQKFSRGATLESFKNVAPAVAAVSAVDSSGNRIAAERQALALSGAISSAIADPEMALTKTATAEVATALAELLPEKDILDAEGKVKRAGTGMKTMLERLTAVQASPELQRRLFETGEGMQAASFRGPIKPVIQELMSSPNSPIAKKFREAFEAISDDPNVVGQIRANLAGASSQLALAESTRKAGGVVEKIQLDSSAGQFAFARQQLEAGLRETGGFWDSAVGNRMNLWQFESDVSQGKIDPITGAIRRLRQRQEDIINPFGQEYSPFLGARKGQTAEQFRENLMAQRTPEERRMAEQLERLIQVLEEQNRLSNKGSGVVAASTLRDNRE